MKAWPQFHYSAEEAQLPWVGFCISAGKEVTVLIPVPIYWGKHKLLYALFLFHWWVFRKLLYDWEEWGWPSKTWHTVFCRAISCNWVGTGVILSTIFKVNYQNLFILSPCFAWIVSVKIQLIYELIIDVFWAFCSLLQNNIYIYRVTVIKYWKDYQLYKKLQKLGKKLQK